MNVFRQNEFQIGWNWGGGMSLLSPVTTPSLSVVVQCWCWPTPLMVLHSSWTPAELSAAQASYTASHWPHCQCIHRLIVKRRPVLTYRPGPTKWKLISCTWQLRLRRRAKLSPPNITVHPHNYKKIWTPPTLYTVIHGLLLLFNC